MGSLHASKSVVLTRRQCLDRLGQLSVGRLALSVDALPVILPVHYTVVGDSVLITTSSGSRLDTAATGAVVAFQADAHDPVEAAWWSVLLQGVATPVTTPQSGLHGPDRDEGRWTASVPRLLRIPADNLAGRQFAGVGPLVPGTGG